MSKSSERESRFAHLLCHLLGHRDVEIPIEYQTDTDTANIEGVIPVTWVCYEQCARCGNKVWWPS